MFYYIPTLMLKDVKGGFPLGEMNGDFAAKFIWACPFFLFIVWLAKYFSSK